MTLITNHHYLYRLLVILTAVVLVVLIALAVITLLHPTKSQAAWYDDTFAYRQKITFSYGYTAISTERRVTITVNTQTLISSSKMQSDCDDTRFTDAGGKALRYQLTGTCDNSATTYSVVFSSIASGPNVGYMYYGNTTAQTASQNVSAIAALGSTTSGGPTKIDDAGDPGALIGNGRQVVRSSTGTLYAFINDGGSCEVWSSSDGTSWSEEDSGNNPACYASNQSIGIAIGSNDTLHLVYATAVNTIKYIPFASGVFGTEETVKTTCASAGCGEMDVAVDSNNAPHVVWRNVNDIVPEDTINYRNRTSGSWQTERTVETIGSVSLVSPTIAINEDNIPEIAYIVTSVNDLTAAVGDANNAASFGLQDVDSDVNATNAIYGASLCVDLSGNTWIGYVDENGATDYITLIKHTDADLWSTWQTEVTNNNAGKEPSVACGGSYQYVFYEDENDDITYDKYTGSWAGETVLQAGTLQDVKVKWSYLNDNQQSTQFDYLYSDATDVYWASLGAAPTVTVASEEQSPGPISYWTFDEGSSGAAQDGTLQNNDLTITNATVKTEDQCVSGKCLGFDGSGDYATKSYSADTELNPNTGSFTVSTWFKHSSNLTGTDYLVSRYSTAAGGTGWKIYTSSSGFCFGTDGDNTWSPTDSACDTTNSYADSQWHHMVAVKAASASLTLYIDGKQISQDASITNDLTATTPPAIYIGIDSDGSSNGWDGYIDEVKYYNFAKTTPQVQTEFVSRGAVKGAAASFSPDTNRSFSQGLVGYWKLDEADWGTPDCSVDVFFDTSGNGLSGDSCPASTGSTGGNGGKFGRAVDFDGTNDYLSIADNTTLDFEAATEDFSLFAWIRRDTSTTIDGVLSKLDGGGDGYQFSITAADVIDFDVDGIDLDGVATITDTNWHHVGVTVDRDGYAQLYVDGKPDGVATAINSEVMDTGQQFGIGTSRASTGADPFDGAIDEARAYSRALSPAEVAALYAFAPGPVGWWKLDEATLTNNCSTDSAFDSSENAFHGDSCPNATGPTSTVVGKYGNAVDFDGSDDYLSVVDNTTLRFDGSTQNFSVFAWIKRDATGTTHSIITKKDGGTDGWEIVIRAANSLVRCRVNTIVEDSTTAITDTSKWYHVGCVFDRNNGLSVYIDGVLDSAPTSISGETLATTDPVDIGRSNIDSTYFNGKIDDVRIYNYARTGKQIIEDMNAGHPAGGSPIASQVIYWKLDEQSIGVVNNANSAQSALSGSFAGTPNPTWLIPENCKINGCVSIADADSFIDGNDVSVTDALSALSVSFWINPQTLSTDGAIISKSSLTAGDNAFFVRTHGTNSDELTIYVGDGVDTADSYSTSNMDLTASTWQHVLVIFDGFESAANRVKVYKDGRAISGSVTGTLPATMEGATTSDLAIGASGVGADALLTYIDEVKIYTSALTDAERKVDMNAGSAAALGGVLGAHDFEGFGAVFPVGWWPMETLTGAFSTSLADISNKDISMTLNSGSPISSAVPGKIGSAMRLNGSGQYISSADNNNLDFGTNSFTVGGWIRHNGAIATNNDYIFAKVDGTNGGYKLYMDDTGDICFVIDDDSSWDTDDSACTSGVDYDDGAWHHIAGMKITTQIQLFIDGVLVASDASLVDTGSLSNTGLVYVGIDSDGTSNSWDGDIDDIQVYDDWLLPASVSYWYNRGSPVAWYKFDECSGPTAYNAATNANGAAAGMNGTITPSSSGNITTGSCSSGTGTEMWNDGTTGKFNSAMGFDNTDDYVTVTNETNIDLNTGLLNGLTASAWVYANGAGESTGGRIFTKNTNTWCRTDTLSGSNLDIECSLDLSTDAVLNVSTAITTGTWHHVAMTWTNDGDDEITVWINGKNRGTSTDGTPGAGDPSADSSNLLIGNGSTLGTTTFDGLIDDVRIYPYEMTQAQMNRLFNEGAAQRFGPSTGSP